MYLFLAKYPDEHTIKDGMFQRISHIDSFFKNDNRVYLSVFLFRNFVKNKKQINKKLICYECNVFIHIFTILSLFIKSKKIYIHSLYNVFPNILYLLLFSKKMILDVHGIVPEENKLVGKQIRYWVFNICERLFFGKKNLTIICVTNSMIEFYKNKYKKYNLKYIRYIIFPNNLDEQELEQNNQEDIVNIVYSGNLQKWQNIDLMLDTIKKTYNNTKYHFYILTGEPDKMQEKFKNFESTDRIKIFTLPPEKLASIYRISHYGFILRDDIDVNNVACPTKLIEYMNYGIVPIVLSDNIGDFKKYGYERILNTEIEKLKPYKSLKNKNIINQIKEENSNIRIKELFDSM